uniref:Uncharacterized protein n=1 Tax=Ixodes ricinus TaxID=34613 RepID=A0A6B0UM22_IXORI
MSVTHPRARLVYRLWLASPAHCTCDPPSSETDTDCPMLNPRKRRPRFSDSRRRCGGIIVFFSVASALSPPPRLLLLRTVFKKDVCSTLSFVVCAMKPHFWKRGVMQHPLQQRSVIFH